MIFWLLVFVVVYVVLVVVWLIWSEHEETKQDQERRRLDAAMRLTEVLDAQAGRVSHPPYLAMQSRKQNVIPRAAGFKSRKVGR